MVASVLSTLSRLAAHTLEAPPGHLCQHEGRLQPRPAQPAGESLSDLPADPAIGRPLTGQSRHGPPQAQDGGRKDPDRPKRHVDGDAASLAALSRAGPCVRGFSWTAVQVGAIIAFQATPEMRARLDRPSLSDIGRTTQHGPVRRIQKVCRRMPGYGQIHPVPGKQSCLGPLGSEMGSARRTQ
jgi:hypothetical protein